MTPANIARTTLHKPKLAILVPLRLVVPRCPISISETTPKAARSVTPRRLDQCLES